VAMGDTCSSCPPKDAPSSGPERTEPRLRESDQGEKGTSAVANSADPTQGDAAYRRTARFSQKEARSQQVGALGDAVDDRPEHIKLATYKTAKSPDANARELISKAMKSDRVCAMLEEGHVNSVLQSVEYFEFPATTRVVKQGDTGESFFVIDEGTLLVEVSGKVVNTMDRGKAFGGLALLYKCPRTASVTAQSACGCWGVTFETLHKVLEETGQKRYAENRKFVDSLRLFDALTSRQKDCFAEEVRPEVFETPGERVVTQGETSSAIHFVKSGELQAFSGGTVSTMGKHEGGKEVARFKAGESFGEHSMLYQEPHQNTVISMTKCELLVIGRESMIKVLGNDYKDFLERNFLSAGLRKSQEISHLNFEQQKALMETMTVKKLPPNDRVESGLRFAIVVDGSLVTADGKTKLPRGQWFEEDSVKRVAGPEGCRLGMLRKADFEKTLKDLGFDSEEHTRKMMVVKKVPLFRFLSDTQVADFVKSFAMKKYTKGQAVFKQGDPGQTFHGIANGEVKVLIDGKSVRTMGAGAYFGERAVLTDDKRSATVEVTSLECNIWSIEKAVFQHILSENMKKELQQRIKLQDTNVVLKELKHIKVIGVGAAGVVRLVEHKTTKMRYALKRVKKKRGKIPEEVDREKRLLAENDHPMVMAMVKTFETAKSVYMLTELITGGELHGAIRKIPTVLTCAQAQFYIGSLVLVLEALADRMIVYRDLKPENVMLDSQGYLKLVDFGIAKKLEEGKAQTFSVIGTPHYMAPEVLNGRGYGLEVDIWSLGVLLYELVCGYLPFADDKDDPTEVCQAVLKAPLKFPRRYKDQVGKDVMEGMMTRQPKKRLGCGINSWEDIKQHSYFRVGYEDLSKRGITLFTKIMGRELEPPWKPAGEEYSDDTDGATLSDAKELG
jgi:cGMP-dependent protein kinase